MHHEGSIHIPGRRHGSFVFLRQKQWWSFEGLDPTQGLYFVFLALEGLPASYVSLKIIDYKNNRRWTEDHIGGFRAAPGDQVDVNAKGQWGHVRFQGRAEESWAVDVQTPSVTVRCTQKPQTPVHHNRLLTRNIDYTILQFAMNMTSGTVTLEGQEYPFQGYGYCEHNWGVQPRHSTANWLHFWMPDLAGIVLSCYYDTGVPHHYTYLWRERQGSYLFSPAQFSFAPDDLESPWQCQSSDVNLRATPLYTHHTEMRLPPILSYIAIDYYEQLVQVKGTATVEGARIEIDGIGKYDHNFNLW